MLEGGLVMNAVHFMHRPHVIARLAVALVSLCVLIGLAAIFMQSAGKANGSSVVFALIFACMAVRNVMGIVGLCCDNKDSRSSALEQAPFRHL
jgi:hypothetical protein